MKVEEIIRNVNLWNPFCENITLSTIFAKMSFGKGTAHMICFGPPGSGKSRSTLELVQALNLDTEIILDNTTTDKGLFETFLEYPEQDIILDECSTLLKSPRTQDMIKLCMEGKPLTWTKDSSIETTAPYKGNLIVNANVPIADAVVDRSFVNKTMMNKRMNLEFNLVYINNISNGLKQGNFFNYLRKVIRDKKEPELTKEEIKWILHFTTQKVEECDKETDYSRRIIIRMLSYFKHAKKLFGSLDSTVLGYIGPFAEGYIVNETCPTLIQNILGNEKLEKAELVRRMNAIGGYSRQHARRLVNKEIEQGNLKLRGKFVLLLNGKV